MKEAEMRISRGSRGFTASGSVDELDGVISAMQNYLNASMTNGARYRPAPLPPAFYPADRAALDAANAKRARKNAKRLSHL
tara:strand:+ start:2374 stop:2616 length:243 start_codon:yes stop_codon:yes gene_type:complete